ncbi:MAG: group II intron reverse transcriptase/maturase [Gemmataceae bacterium]
MEDKPSTVPATAPQGGDIRARWAWVEPAVWTDPMLTALEQGVKGGKWFRLIDKVFSEKNLLASHRKVEANKGAPGVDHVTIEEFSRQLGPNLENLTAALRGGTYRPQAIRRVFIPKPGGREQRPLGIPTVRDRVVQGAVRHVLEPIFEREFAEQSYGFRPGRGCKDALRRVDHLLKNGFEHVVDVDLKSYFDTIPHGRLMNRVRERVADGRVLDLVEAFLKAGIMNGLEETEPEMGAPQGAVLSPLLSNIYLNPLDHLMVSKGFEMVRYADDFVILCRSREEAEQALAIVCQWCEAEGLTVHPTKTKVVHVRREGFDFLGYHFQATQRGRLTRWPREKSLMKLRDTIRSKTRRTNGNSLECVILDLNRSLRGWFGYFKHSCRQSLRQIDMWIRGRLRTLLRKRSKRSGFACGEDQKRYRNAFFEELGLFNLTAAHGLEGQSPRG